MRRSSCWWFLLLLLAAPVAGQRSGLFISTFANLPATCTPQQPFVVSDANATCTAGGGAPRWCLCTSAGNAYEAGGALALLDLSDVTAKAGSGTVVVLDAGPTIDSPTISTRLSQDGDIADGGGYIRLQNESGIQWECSPACVDEEEPRWRLDANEDLHFDHKRNDGSVRYDIDNTHLEAGSINETAGIRMMFGNTPAAAMFAFKISDYMSGANEDSGISFFTENNGVYEQKAQLDNLGIFDAVGGFTVAGSAPANRVLMGNGSDGQFTQPLLASAHYANQGTTTTLLHGAASGNPSWGSVVPADADLSVNWTWDNNADAPFTGIRLQAGSAADQNTWLQFNAFGGGAEWQIGKTAANDFSVRDDTQGISRVLFVESGDNTYRLGSATSDHLFRARSDAIRARILGDAPTLCLGTAEDACFTRSAAGVYGLNATAGIAPTVDGQFGYDSTSDTFEYGDSGSTRTVVGRDTADTLTNKELDGEGTGNVLTLPFQWLLPTAACDNATAGPMWDLFTANVPSVACFTGSNSTKGVFDFDPTTAEFAQIMLKLPSDWTDNVDVDLTWFAAATTGATRWSIQTACTAVGETDDPAWGTADDLNDTAQGTTLQTNEIAFSAIAMAGCAAGELFHLRVGRDAADAGDTMGGDARLSFVEVTHRRAI